MCTGDSHTNKAQSEQGNITEKQNSHIKKKRMNKSGRFEQSIYRALLVEIPVSRGTGNHQGHVIAIKN